MKINYQLILLAITTSFFAGFQSVKGQGTVSGNTANCRNNNYKTNWTSKPYDHQVFIENQGQFKADVKTGDKILYGAQVGDVYAFITNHGIIYKFVEKPCMEVSEDHKHYSLKDPDDIDRSAKNIDHYLTATWEGSGNDVTTEAGAQETYYETYPMPGKKTVIAHVFKTVTCKNVYPGIDVEYTFPTDNKSGIKYNFIVHPGADASVIKLKYDGALDMVLDNDGNVKINTGWGDFMDHAPVSYYSEDHSTVTSGYKLNNDEETFVVNNIDATKTLTIDPWTTNWTQNPGFTNTSGYDGAYDLDYDYQGNVYIYGGWNPFQEIKYNSAGVKQWVFNASNLCATDDYYGDVVCDKASGNTFLLQGFGYAPGAEIDEVSPAGVQTANFLGNSSMEEMWRGSYDLCDHIILIAGGGGSSSNQAATIDTSLTTLTLGNVLNLPTGGGPAYGYHDMALEATDPLLGIGYMATTKSTGNSSVDNNVVLQMPVPAMVPVNYNVQDNYAFDEIQSVTYVGPNPYMGYKAANGMNGMTVSPNWFYMYDGVTLEQHNKGTGAMTLSASLGGTPYASGGLDVDLCDNIYAGHQSNIELYNASLANTGNIGPMPNTVYCLMLGNGVVSGSDSTLYVCGNGFVSSLHIDPPNPPTTTKTRTEVCQCACTATPTLDVCGNPVTVGVTYLWSNAQTTQTATGLCPGNTYTCTIHYGCEFQYIDTFNFPLVSTMTLTKSQTDQTCLVQGTASVTVAGGTPPYTYLWSPNNQTTANITGLSAGNYCVTVTDNKGCQDSVCYIITSPPLPTVTVPTATVCVGSPATLTTTVAGGTAPYNYLWNTTATTSSITVSPAATTTYTVTVSDANGCTGSTTVVVTVNQPPTVTIAPQNDTICAGVAGGVALTANPVGTGPFSYNWTPINSNLSSYTVANPTATPTVTTIYTVTVTDANGCTGTATTTVVIAEPPTINVSATKVSICEGFSVNLIASATNTTSPFTWQPGNMTGPVVSVTPTVTTAYTVTASSGCGLATATITINVNQLPVPSFSVDNAGGCLTPTFCVQFRNHSTSASGNITQWTWTFGNGDSAIAQSPIFCYTKPGSYEVTLTVVSDSGCSATLQKSNYINVYSNPNASFTMSPQPTTILQPTIQFTDQSTDAYGIVYWSWNFGVPGNDTLSSLQNPTYNYWDTGTFCPTEVVMNVHGCMDTTSQCLEIDPIYALYIPSAFTPNGDGKNEVFMARGNDVKSFEMYIYDRWGMQLFHSTDINNGWPGTVNGGGTICQEDTYVYVITAYDHKNHRHSFTGSVNLIK